MRTILVLSCIILLQKAYPQVSGKVTLKYAGIAFTIPEGWVAQETETGYILGSAQEPGAIIMMGHRHTTLEGLKHEAVQGLYDESGTQLTIDGNVQTLTNTSIGGIFTGTLQGSNVKAYAISLLNPYGMGVTIFAVTTPDLYSDRYVQLANMVANSIDFSKPVQASAVNEWKRALHSARLTYIDNYSGNNGGYSDKIVFDLCETGYFKHSRNYSLSVDTDGAFGNDASNGTGSGKWMIVQDAQGNAVLQLHFHNGQAEEYSLQYNGDQTLLNGRRYFRTYDASCP